MRVLLVNPNVSVSITQRLAQVARGVAAPGTEITAVTAPRGVPYISCRAEAQLAGAVVLEMLAEHGAGHDAALIGAFGDPGLWAARELFDLPIVGMAEASMHMAAMLGQRFSIVTFAPALGHWYRDCVEASGLACRLAAIRSLTASFGSLDMVAEEKAEALVRLCEVTVREDDADVVVLAGAPLAGLAGQIAHRVPVPLVEQVAAGIGQAEMLVRLATARGASLRRPAPKTSQGLPPALASRIAHADA
ncbi:aspartate/glutamate racemase family protein [Aurantimonas endophytica]|uniref:Asp/Glu/hydantoin racemase n=1 Tax=Aurantimonas endophytica TaxID=1522175 RepID=A0A7W6MNP3_9HYPH|nr:Asp/Glu/hydantoin racemase [Aurantimonas endophytica]MCO6402325.1 Asp/Glu/hydantoin racemase [Aurantimonas endophytica]